MIESREAIDVNLHNLWLALKRRWLPAASVFGCVMGLSALATSFQQPVYEAEGKLLLKKVNQTSSITELGQTINNELEPLAQEGIPANTEIEIIRSVPLAEKTITTLNLKDEQGDRLSPKAFISQLNLKNIPSTDVVQVAYESDNPQEAALVVNKLMSLYVDSNVLNNRAETVAAGDFISKQLPATEVTVRQAEAALRQFKEQNQIINLDEEAKAAVTAIKALEDQVTTTEAAIAQAKTRSEILLKKIALNSGDVISLNSLNQSPGVQKILEELQQVEANLAIQKTRFEAKHPTIVGLNNQKAALKALLEQRIAQFVGDSKQVSNQDLQMGALKQKLTEELVASEVERLSLTSRLAFLSKAELASKQRAKILPQLEQNQRELERRVRAAQSTYEILLRKLQEVKVEENRNVGNSRIIETALAPEQPLNRQKTMTLGLGTILALLLATATILVLEISDTSVKTPKEIREVFEYTWVASIPYFGKKVTSQRKKQDWTIPEVPVINTPRSSVAEAYRMLQANLKFLSSDKALKVVVVTSSIPKEGKSTVSANLAAAIAQLGRRVLLVDADLRCPLQHHIWNLTNATGLSNVIVNQAKFQTTVKEVMTKLHVLTAGVIPPNPMALLDSQRMASLVDYFAAEYDFVIIDAPPLLVAADTLTLGKMTDGILLVARPGMLDVSSAVNAKESLECSCQKVLGIVVNGVTGEKEPYSHLYHSSENHNNQDSTQFSSRN